MDAVVNPRSSYIFAFIWKTDLVPESCKNSATILTFKNAYRKCHNRGGISLTPLVLGLLVSLEHVAKSAQFVEYDQLINCEGVISSGEHSAYFSITDYMLPPNSDNAAKTSMIEHWKLSTFSTLRGQVSGPHNNVERSQIF
ncbi:hypothetical protein CSKR_104633 [Clonorchis sinensis]|uniref:Uncharacterized protein n=1 Tax=Clonorchis sinensis TaxID=79923 RepID=A0A419PLV9_CLOSI|nr:hypothetical protein CSKR_104633 [Clonorchis sinensis]